MASRRSRLRLRLDRYVAAEELENTIACWIQNPSPPPQLKILLDDDLASNELIGRLRDLFGAQNVLAPERGQPDELVWTRAHEAGATR
jgi:hypothetical protein